MNELLWWALGFSFLLYVSLRSFERWILPKIPTSVKTLDEREVELQQQITDLQRRLVSSEQKNEELAGNQKMLLEALGKANQEIARQQEQITVLNSKVKELEKTAPITPIETKPFAGRVLGIWPQNMPKNGEKTLLTVDEKNNLAKTGLEYEALEGDLATRRGIVEQLGQRDYRILEIGAKGAAKGVMLKDGIAPPEWWMRLAKQHQIEIFVVLANESSKPGIENVADALYNAGARAVVSVDSSILDIDAIEFARMFYRRLSRGVPLAKAVEYAKLVISDAGSDTIKLRERS